MTTVTQSTTGAQPPAPTPAVSPSGSTAVRLVRAEILKLWTTNTWWIFGICALAATGLALLVNGFQADYEIGQAHNPPNFNEGFPPGQGPPPEDIARQQQNWAEQFNLGRILLTSAANLYTSGQFFGLMFVMLIGTLIVTNEFHHQTATATFLTTPKRTEVILAKLGGAVGIAGVFWLVSTIISISVGVAFFAGQGETNSLGEWPVTRAILFNLLAYAIWAVLGVGIGVLIRSQLGATLTGGALYFLGLFLAQGVFYLIYAFLIKEEWVLKAMVLVPGVASSVMIAPTPPIFGNTNEGAPIYGPQWWVGALVLVGYGVLAGAIGTLITRKRDIS